MRKNEWISIYDKLPKDGQRVIVDYGEKLGGIMIIRFNIRGIIGFKAWMPCPEPYKEK